MGLSTLVMIACVGIVFMAWYANSSKRNVILCNVRRANKTLVSKFVKMQSRFVIFEGKKYDVVPSRIVFKWYNQGLVHWLFPQWVATLDYTEGKRFPLDTNKLNYDWESPEYRKNANVAEVMKSYMTTSAPPGVNKKQPFYIAWLPWIAIILVIVVAFYFNSKMTGFGHTLDSVVGEIAKIPK